MYTDVYVDVLFLINFSMDVIALCLCGRLCSLRIRPLRAGFSAVIGALYCISTVFFSFAVCFELVLTILVSFLMVYITFDVSNFREGLKTTAVLFVCSSLLGGIITALYSLVSKLNYGTENVGARRISFWGFVILAIVSILLSFMLTRLHGSGNMPQKVRVRIKVLGKWIESEAIVDSGNLLVEPISRKNVIIVKSSMLTKTLSREYISAASNGDITVAYRLASRERAVFVIIPASSIGGDSFIIGVRTEAVVLYVEKKGREYKLSRDAVIGLSDSLCKDIDAIVPYSLI